MTREADVELIERAYALWRAGDFQGLLAVCAEDIVWVPPANMPEPHTRQGKDALGAGIDAYFEVFEEFWPEAEEVLDTSRPGAYLVMARTHTKGRGSGARITIPVAHLIEIEDGLVTRLQVFADRDVARAQLGLEA